ncbi:MAG: hypothetical protein ABI690_31610 [Chloroflexota bacterium]
MQATFGADLYNGNSAFTILMPKAIHRAISLFLGDVATWTWKQVLERVNEDFKRIPEECKRQYWEKFREEAQRAVCGVLEANIPSQDVNELFLRALDLFYWFEETGYSDPCTADLNDYARSLPRVIS